MPSFSTNEVVLVRYPFTDLTAAKVRPAVVVGTFSRSPDHVIVPLTSRTGGLADGEFVLSEWAAAGLHVETAVKRGIYTVHSRLMLKSVGRLNAADAAGVQRSLRLWLGLA
jgi:mRNA interferase MazF